MNFYLCVIYLERLDLQDQVRITPKVNIVRNILKTSLKDNEGRLILWLLSKGHLFCRYVSARKKKSICRKISQNNLLKHFCSWGRGGNILRQKAPIFRCTKCYFSKAVMTLRMCCTHVRLTPVSPTFLEKRHFHLHT